MSHSQADAKTPSGESYRPCGYSNVTPYLQFQSVPKAIEFYAQALGAVELFRLPGPGGAVMHAEIMVGDAHLMMSDFLMPGSERRNPATSPVSFMVYVPDVDASLARAVDAGAHLTRPAKNEFWGDRAGGIQDPFGYEWTLATKVEDVPPDELERRMTAYSAG